jgi:hypothetical protein
MTDKSPNHRMMTFHIPEDQNILVLIGMISLRHSHLDYILRMTIKTLAEVSINQALDATRYHGSSQLRRRILKLAKQRLGEGRPLIQLEALLGRCERATEKRNRLVHEIWAKELDGEPFVRTENHEWEPTPSITALDQLADELKSVTQELNNARLDGFLHEALNS